jgi:hypothetical protein
VQSATTILTKDQIAVAPFLIPGKIEYPLFGFIAMLTGTIERPITRKAGRELFLERGRAPRRART